MYSTSSTIHSLHACSAQKHAIEQNAKLHVTHSSLATVCGVCVCRSARGAIAPRGVRPVDREGCMLDIGSEVLAGFN